ncbi:MAG: MarR family transcriptional regulator [Bacteroidales bacterium]|nr:MarR family transcriptional regulator [Bacteroidales bacterium]
MYDQLKLDNQLCFRFYTVSRLIAQAYRPMLEPLGLTYPQYLVMLVLWEHDNQTISDITGRLGLETNTVTPLIQRMEKAGLVVRTKGIVDSRQTLVSLTKRGQHLEQEAREVPECIVRSLTPKGSEPDTELAAQTTALLDSLIATLREATQTK